MDAILAKQLQRLEPGGQLTGLDNISIERTIELIPSLTLRKAASLSVLHAACRSPDPGRMVNEPVKLDPGLTAKFTPSSALTLDLALNPTSPCGSRPNRCYGESAFSDLLCGKRPFFLEGIDIFQTPVTVVHTRAIVDPDVAVKLTGKKGRNTFGMMVASDNGPGSFVGDERLNPNNFRFLDKNAYVGVLRLKRDVGKENSIGILATSYNFIEKHNQLMSLDGRFQAR